MRTTHSRRWTATTSVVRAIVVATLIWNARESAGDPIEPDPLGLHFCNGGFALETPIGIEPPFPLVPGSCVKTQTDDYTLVGGYYDMQCGAPGSSSMQEHSLPGYADATASLGFGPGRFGTLAAGSLNAGHGGPAGARTWGYVVDEVTVGGGTGRGTLHVPLHLTGASYVYATRMNGVPDPTAYAGISVQCVDSTSPITSCNGVVLDFSNQTNLQNMPTPIDETIDMTIPFTFGTPADFAIYACSVAVIGADPALGAIVSVDFSHTGVVEKSTVLDALGNEVPGATITSASGFDYLNAPAGTGSTTTTLAASTTTTTTAGASTTSTTLAPCGSGLQGVQCVLASLPPAACASDALPAGFAHHLGKASAATTAALHASTVGKRRHLVHKVGVLLAGADRIVTKASRKKKAPLSPGCAATIHGALMQAKGLLATSDAG